MSVCAPNFKSFITKDRDGCNKPPDFSYLFSIDVMMGDRILANLHQINVQFDPMQDRLILRVRSDDDSEVLAWMTRRFTKLLLGILAELANRSRSAEKTTLAEDAVKSFQRDVALANADFSSNYDQSATSHPLGKQPVLLSSINYKPAEKGRIALSLGLPDKRSINLNLSRDLLFVFIKLLGEGGKSAEWDLAVASHQALESSLNSSGGQVIH